MAETPKTHEQVMAELIAEDREFREAYDELQPEYELKRALVRARLEDGLTQAELARRMGMKQSAISRMEAGPFDPRLTTLRKLAAALNVRIEIAAQGLKVVHLAEGVAGKHRRPFEKTA